MTFSCYALVDAAADILRIESLSAAPSALAPEKGLKWLPVLDERPAPDAGETLGDPVITVEADKVRRTWSLRPKTYAERYAEVLAARRAAYPPIGDQLDAAFKARMGDGAELSAIDAAIQAVKAAHPKPAA